jgi:hypothetical protein
MAQLLLVRAWIATSRDRVPGTTPKRRLASREGAQRMSREGAQRTSREGAQRISREGTQRSMTLFFCVHPCTSVAENASFGCGQ